MSGAVSEGKTETKIHSGSNYFWPCFFVGKRNEILIDKERRDPV
jgi:hypothetical protein